MANQEPQNALDAWMAHIDQAPTSAGSSRGRELLQKAVKQPAQPNQPAK